MSADTHADLLRRGANLIHLLTRHRTRTVDDDRHLAVETIRILRHRRRGARHQQEVPALRAAILIGIREQRSTHAVAAAKVREQKRTRLRLRRVQTRPQFTRADPLERELMTG